MRVDLEDLALIALLDQARGGRLRLVTNDPATIAPTARARLDHHVAVHRVVCDARASTNYGNAPRP
jgi:hypothetical protein